jgi:hypothetical protein
VIAKDFVYVDHQCSSTIYFSILAVCIQASLATRRFEAKLR